jgi:hypothetical protein
LTKPFELNKAIDLLSADLVWSDDFDAIRDSLAMLLIKIRDADGETIRYLLPELTDLIADLGDEG